MLHERAQAVVAGVPAAELQPHLAERQIELVVEDDDLARRDVKERHRRLHAAPRFVHEGLGAKKDARRDRRACPW